MLRLTGGGAHSGPHANKRSSRRAAHSRFDGGGVMRIVAFITQPSVIDQIVTHLRPRHHCARRRAEPPNDPGRVGTGRPATTRSDPPRPLSTAPTP